jgi:2-polyprenyl-3-methyl-5-hydroxy-6-metoxy-1,4-benzoquinol methylase
MQKRHQDNNLYFEEQSVSTKKYVIPYIEQVRKINENTTILEIGCGQGGNLLPFLEAGCYCTGMDIDKNKILMGQDFFRKHPLHHKIELFYDNIYELDPNNFKKFDIIILRDVIEHLPDKVQLLKLIKLFLKKDGIVFFAFPPWRMPFGGHQQILKNKILATLPFYHILPVPVYRWMLKLGKTKNEDIEEMLKHKQTGISISKFQKIVKQNGYKFIKTTDWFINPNYEVKFNLKPRKLYFFNKIPFFRDFFTTSYYAIIESKN